MEKTKLISILLKSQMNLKPFFKKHKIPPTIVEDLHTIQTFEKLLKAKDIPFKSFKELVNK